MTDRGPDEEARAVLSGERTTRGAGALVSETLVSEAPPRERDARLALVADDFSTTVLRELRVELERAVAAGDTGTRCRVHELVAGYLAARGEWSEAYHELRASVDLGRGLGAGREPQLVAEVARLRRETAEARSISMRDALTESFNRRFLDQQLRSLSGSSDHTADPAPRTGVALVDLDLFKLVNDRFGHQLGDRVLQRVVELLQADLPEGAFCARYGGEEFVLVLRGAELRRTVALCEAARARVEQHDWSTEAEGLKVTVSIGVAGPWCTEPLVTGEGSPAQDQLRRADGLLYAAKRSGRNAVAFRSGPAEPMQLAGAASGRRLQVEPPRSAR